MQIELSNNIDKIHKPDKNHQSPIILRFISHNYIIVYDFQSKIIDRLM